MLTGLIAALAVVACVSFYMKTEAPVPDYTEKGAELVTENTEVPWGGKSKYYFIQLSDIEKHAYNNILNEIESFPKRVEVPALNEDELNRVFEAIFYDNPTLFFLERKCSLRRVGRETYFYPQYFMTKEAYGVRRQELSAEAGKALALVRGVTGDFEKELILHDWVLDKCVYGKNETFEESTAYGAIVTGTASCEGYSKAMKYLLEEAGVECYVMCGESQNSGGESQSHMWNVVKISGDYYHLDATWNDPVTQEGSPVQRYNYFNLTDAELSLTHSGYTNLNPCTATKENYYVKSGLYFETYDGAARDRIVSVIAGTADAGKDQFELKFASEEAFSFALEKFFEQNEIYKLLARADRRTDAKINSREASYIVNEKHTIIKIIFKFND